MRTKKSLAVTCYLSTLILDKAISVIAVTSPLTTSVFTVQLLGESPTIRAEQTSWIITS